jgi:hypothetical protein
MRCDQHFGLPKEALEFLAENEKTLPICTCCKRPFPLELEQIGTYTGMFCDKFPLYRHFLTDGKVADEFLQADPWSSGPCFFIGLKVSNGEIFEWPQETIDGA